MALIFSFFPLDNSSIYTIMQTMSKKSRTQKTFAFDDHFRRTVQADFSGGHLSGDGGALLPRQGSSDKFPSGAMKVVELEEEKTFIAIAVSGAG